jgi:hypothetical protein
MLDFDEVAPNVPQFRAAGDHITIKPEFADEDHQLRLDGRMIDEVEEVANAWGPMETPQSTEQYLELQCLVHRYLLI